MSIEIIPRVVEALHSREASLRASRECNASTTRGIISILIVLVGSSYIIFFGFCSKILGAIFIYHRSNCDESAWSFSHGMFLYVRFDIQLQRKIVVQDILSFFKKIAAQQTIYSFRVNLYWNRKYITYLISHKTTSFIIGLVAQR